MTTESTPANVGAMEWLGVSVPERDILRHALGLGRSNREYRNHFVTGPGSTDYPHCEALVAAGLMTKRPGHPLSGGDPIYYVTEAGRAALDGIVLQRGPEGNLEGFVPRQPCGCREGECESKPGRACRMVDEIGTNAQ